MTLEAPATFFRPFLHVTWVWALASLAWMGYRFSSDPELLNAVLVFAGFWFLSICSLYSLTRLVALVLELSVVSSEKRTALVIRASYWGVFKLVSVGILITALILVSKVAIPPIGIAVTLGISTVCVVPLVGGYIWSRKVIQHA